MARQPAASTNLEAIETSIEALRLAGRLDDPGSSAIVQVARSLAAAVDEITGDTIGAASMWREYRAAVAELLRVGADVVDDSNAAFWLEVKTPRLPS